MITRNYLFLIIGAFVFCNAVGMQQARGARNQEVSVLCASLHIRCGAQSPMCVLSQPLLREISSWLILTNTFTMKLSASNTESSYYVSLLNNIESIKEIICSPGKSEILISIPCKALSLCYGVVLGAGKHVLLGRLVDLTGEQVAQIGSIEVNMLNVVHPFSV